MSLAGETATGRRATADEEHLLLDVRGVTVGFPADGGHLVAVREVSFGLRRGETLGIVGESGSGKSLTALSLLRLLPPPGRILAGDMTFDGTDLLRLPEREMRQIRGRRIAMVFQDPMTGLNPVRTVGATLVETIRRHSGIGRRAADQRAVEALRDVGIPAPEQRLRAYPHQLSGGLRQRVMIALALANRPDLIVADEPTTALDATIQAQILDLLRQRLESSALILITHDLGVAAELCDRIAVMYAGRIVEHGPAADILDHPRHPYTVGLLEAAPRLDVRRDRFTPIPGNPPQLHQIASGCAFAPRCPRARELCATRPELEPRNGRPVACHFPHDD